MLSGPQIVEDPCCSLYLTYVRCWKPPADLNGLLSGAKVNAARLHETPLHHAARNMRVEMIEILVEFGANIYARDQHDKKPVDYTTPGSPSAACLQFYESKSPQRSVSLAPADGKQVSFFTSRKSQIGNTCCLRVAAAKRLKWEGDDFY